MALHLAPAVHDRDVMDLDLEQELHRLADFLLGRVPPHTEGDLVVRIGDDRALLRHVRSDEDVHQPLLAPAVVDACVHARRSSTSFRAGTVISTFSKRISTTGSSAGTSQMPTSARFRADRKSFSSKPSVTISTLPSPSSFSFAASSRVFGASISSVSVTTRRPCRTSSEKTERSAPRYILRFTFCA